MKILITGGSGYLGARLSCQLADMGHKVSSLFRHKPGNVDARFDNINLMLGDLTNPETYDELYKMQFDAIIHTVSLGHSKSEEVSFETLSSTNILPTGLLLENFVKNGLKKFIYLSTIQVLGPLPSEIIGEDYQGRPQNKYGLTHALGEEIVSYYNQKYNCHCSSLRLSNCYGSPIFPETNCWSLVINDLCKQAYFNKKIILRSDGSPTRDFIHVKDFMNAIELILNSKNEIENLYHVSSGITRTLGEVALLIGEVYANRYSKEIPIYHSTSSRLTSTNQNKDSYVISNKKLVDLGMTLELDINKGIQELFSYFDTNAH